MGRNKNYDQDQVLQTLSGLFAETGYEATSIDQIAKATGMKRGSIYQAFDSKANLFRLAFQHALEHETDSDLLADLVFVAMWERAGIDPVVRTTALQAIAHLESESGKPMVTIMEQRLLLRAGITDNSTAR